MLFGRKNPEKWNQKLRILLWPRRSWIRSFKYVTKRILRLTGSPHAIAAGVGAGVFASFTPFLGFHFVIAFVVAYIIAGNFLAAALGTFFGNPLSFPLIWASTYKTGNFILEGSSGENTAEELKTLKEAEFMDNGIVEVWDNLLGLWDPVIKPMFIGSIPLGVLFGISAYVVTRWAAVTFKRARKKRMDRKSGAVANS